MLAPKYFSSGTRYKLKMMFTIKNINVPVRATLYLLSEVKKKIKTTKIP